MSPKKSPKERWTLKDAADELSKRSHAWETPNTPNEWLAILEKGVTEGLLQPQGGEVLADDVNALLDAHPERWTSSARLPVARLETTVIRSNVSMHAADWFVMEAVSPKDAASLLCQSDPMDERLEPENTTTDETGPGDFRLLHRVFLDVERSDPGCRTLLEWLKIAKARGCKYHSWVDRYLEARGQLGSPVGSNKVKPGDAPKVAAGGISKVPKHGGDMKHESLVGLIEPYADGPFDKLPDDLRQCVIEAFATQSAAFDAQQWNALTPNQRRAMAQEWDLVQQIETQAAYDETGLNGTSIDWRYWVHQMTTLSAAEASRLMSALDPDIFSSLDGHPGMDDPSRHCEKAGKIQRLAERSGMVDATPSAWLAWAVARGILVHAGFRIEVERLPAELPQNSKTLTLPGTESKQTPVPPAGTSGGTEKKWTPEKLAELRAYRDKHTMPQTSKKFGISGARVRQLLPTEKPKAKPFASLIHRME